MAGNKAGPFTIYSAGGLFTQDELAMNVLIKEAVWRLSQGKFQLFLPQSRELQELDRPNVEAYLRNTDLLEVLKADIILARFDGLELDSGTVLEFAMAKFLGKPTVILRTDFRRLSCTGLSEPYNLMVMNWPRTVEIQLDSYQLWAGLFAGGEMGPGDNDIFQNLMKTELATLQNSVDEVACQVITGLDKVLMMESPYPPEYQELVYRAARHSIGSGFEELLSSNKLEEIIIKLKNNHSL